MIMLFLRMEEVLLTLSLSNELFLSVTIIRKDMFFLVDILAGSERRINQ